MGRKLLVLSLFAELHNDQGSLEHRKKALYKIWMGNKRSRPYCTAPWMEVHLNYNGETRPCDHSFESLGNWKQHTLEGVWRGDGYRQFRESIARGDFPTESCRSCVLNSTTSNLYNSVLLYLNSLQEKFVAFFGAAIPELDVLIDFLLEPDTEWKVIEENFNRLNHALLEKEEMGANGECAQNKAFIDHLNQLQEMTKSYIHGEVNPHYVGPIRQARLINKCNARCVMCAGKFTGDIVNGPGMDSAALPTVLERSDHILSFSSEASEFLLFPQWREIVESISAKGLPKLRLFTNGILLNPENVRFLIDRNALEMLLISMNGTSKEVLESIQVGVRFDRLMENIRFLLQYANDAKADFQLTFSFIVMRRNHHEMPGFVELIHDLTKTFPRIKPVVFFPFLESNVGLESYRDFFFAEHHSLVNEKSLMESFTKTEELARGYGILATLKEETLESFLRSGKKIAPIPYRENDVPSLERLLNSSLTDISLEHLIPVTEGARNALLEAMSSS